MTLVCTVLPIFEAGKTKQTVNKQKLWPFFYYPVFVPNTCFVLQATPPKNRQGSNNQQHSQFLFFPFFFFLYKLLLPCFGLLEFPLFWFLSLKKQTKTWNAPLITRRVFLMSRFFVLFNVEVFGPWAHMFSTPVTTPLLVDTWPIITAEFVCVVQMDWMEKLRVFWVITHTRQSPEQSENK